LQLQRGWAKVRVRERWGNSDTFSNSVDKELGCKLRGVSERQQPRAKNIAHANDGGGAWTPLDPPLDTEQGGTEKNGTYKRDTLFLPVELRQMLTDFQTSFTITLRLSKTAIKDPTTPQTYRYTTLWNINHRQSETNVSFNNKFNLIYYS